MTTTSHLHSVIEKFVESRGWIRHHTLRNLAEAISIESGELLREFQWDNEFDNPVEIENIRRELADVMIYCIAMANRLDEDIGRLVLNKILLNSQKYPI